MLVRAQLHTGRWNTCSVRFHFLEAILFPMVVAVANFRLSSLHLRSRLGKLLLAPFTDADCEQLAKRIRKAGNDCYDCRAAGQPLTLRKSYCLPGCHAASRCGSLFLSPEKAQAVCEGN